MTRPILRIPEGDLRFLSLKLEERTGFDSILTIEKTYITNDEGQYQCVFPDCAFVSEHPGIIWKHLHFEYTPRNRGHVHPLSFDITYDRLVTTWEEFLSELA